MTRPLSLCFSSLLCLTALGCGGHPTSPGEMPPVAPRPELGDPTAKPPPRSIVGPSDARPAPLHPTPGPAVSMIRAPEFRAERYQAGDDAGISVTVPLTPDAGAGVPDDAGMPSLPPIPDAGVPADTRLEPSQVHD